jgi:hypothetical protein
VNPVPTVIPAQGAFQKPRRIKTSPNFTPPTVIPAKAGIEVRQGFTHAPWIPACAGMTVGCSDILMRRGFWKAPQAGIQGTSVTPCQYWIPACAGMTIGRMYSMTGNVSLWHFGHEFPEMRFVHENKLPAGTVTPVKLACIRL